MNYQINYNSHGFNLELVHKLLEQHKGKCGYLLVISPNGVGKTLFMLEVFKQLEKEKKLCGFIVRNKSGDYQRPLTLIKTLETEKIRYKYNKTNYIIYRQDLKEIDTPRGVKLKGIDTKVGYIVNIYDAPNIKSFPINDCKQGFYDEVSNLLAQYSNCELKALNVIIKASGRHDIETGGNIMLFGNMDDKYNIYLDEFKNKGKKYNKYFSVIQSKINPEMVKIYGKYEPNNQFLEATKGSITDLVSEFDEDEYLMAKTTDGVATTLDSIIMPKKYAKLESCISLSGKKFNIYTGNGFMIIGNYEPNKKPITEVFSYDREFRNKINDWFVNNILKFTSKEVLKEFNKIVRFNNFL